MRFNLKAIAAVAAIASACSTGHAQNSGAAWTQTIERALAAQGISATAVADLKNGVETLHLTVNGKTVAEPVRANAGNDYSSTVYVVMDGVESRMHYMYPVSGQVNSQMRPVTASTRRGNQQQPRPMEQKINYDPARDWHSHSNMYKPDEIFEDIRDLDLLEIALENGVSDAVRVKLIDPSYAKSVPASEKLLLLRARVIDIQRGVIYEKPKEGAPAPAQPKISRKLAYTNINIQLIDDMTGEVVWQDSIEDDYNTIMQSSDPMDDCLRSIKNDLTRVLDGLFPFVAPRLSSEGNVTALDSFKKEKANTVFVNLGSSNELKKGDTLEVYLQQNIAGNAGLTQIGSLTVSEVQGPNLSLCKVKKGEKEIYNALQNGQTLVVQTNW